MDSLTHLLMGHAMGAAASAATPAHGAAVYWAALIGNSLPDIDVPVSLLLRRDVKLHRTVTHTIPGVIALSAIAAIAIDWFVPGAPFALIFGWTLLASLVHMGMDCLNLFGAQPFWPVSRRPVELGVLHILDPILLVLLGLPSLGSALGLASPSLLILSFFLMWPYVLLRIATARKLYRKLREDGSLRARIVPWYLGWRYVNETPTAIEIGLWIRGRRQPLETFSKQHSPLIQASLTDPDVAAFLKSAEWPYASVQEEEGGHTVVWGDAVRRFRADFRPLQVRIQG